MKGRFLRHLMALCLYTFPILTFGQLKQMERSPLHLTSRMENNKALVSKKESNKPLNSPYYLKTYQLKLQSSLYDANFGFIRKESTKALKNTTALGDEKIYGNLIYSDAWADLAIYEIPYGVYSFHPKQEADMLMHYENIGLNCNAAAYANGKFYGIHPITLWGGLTGIGYFIVNTETWETEYNLVSDDTEYTSMASNMTFDATTNTIYALRYNEDLSGYYWATLDTTNFTFNTLATWPGNFSTVTLTTTPDGTIYGIGSNGNLYTFDKADGTPTLIGATGAYPENYTQSAVYHGSTGTLLWYAITYGGAAVYTVDLTTAEATKLYDLDNNEEFVGLFTKETAAPDQAPAAVNDVAFNFTTPGDLSGSMDFTVPAYAYDGSALSGMVSAKILLDGELVVEEELVAGSSYQYPFELAEGYYAFTILVSNDAGTSPATVEYQYMGYDYPKAVTQLSYEIVDGESQLAWEAPVEGIHEGYVNPDSIYYEIVRLPDNEVVVSDLKATSFSEVMPSAMKRYAYQVVAYNGVNKKGAVAETDEIIFGDGFEPPYAQLFEDEDALNYYTIVDHNEDAVTWMQLSSTVAYWTTYDALDGDDWLITPAMQFKADYRYRLEFVTKALWSPAVEHMQVSVGTDQTDLSSFTQLIWEDATMDYYDYTSKFVDIDVDTDGKYYYGFHALSSLETGVGLYIDDIYVTCVGALAAPAMVSNLSVTPDADDALEATIGFTVPTTRIDGDILASDPIRIDIYRNDDLETPVHSIANPVAGALLSWTDTEVPFVGYNKYTVMAVNAAGNGEKAEADAFVGVYEAPYEQGFDEEASIRPFTFYELNATNGDWAYDTASNTIQLLNYYNVVDDWMILPAIKLEGETVYEFSIDYAHYGTETFDFTLGTSIAVEDQVWVDSLPRERQYDMATSTSLFSINEAGKYYPGIHLESNASIYYYQVQLDNIQIERKGSVKAPGAVENLKLVADHSGGRSVQITFNAPSQGYNGGDLESVSKIEIYHSTDLTPVYTFENPAVGQALSWTDTYVNAGYMRYAIKTENEYGQGVTAIDSVYVGVDVPASITVLDIVADASNLKASLSWDKAVAENGGYINLDALKYNVYQYDATEGVYDLIAEGISDTTYQVEMTNTDTLELLYYGVAPELNGYEAEPRVSYVVLGAPYTVPFQESFTNMGLTTSPWVAGGDDYSSWVVTSEIYTGAGATITSSDDDEGLIFFYNAYGYGYGILELPKIELFKKSIVENVFSFWMYEGEDIATEYSYVQFFISENGEAYGPLTDTLRLHTGNGWTKHEIDLQDYVDANYITIKAACFTASASEALVIDNFEVFGVYPEDLAVHALSGNEELSIGDSAVYTLSIENRGQNAVAAADFTLNLYSGSTLLATCPGVDLEAAIFDTVQLKFWVDAPLAGTTLKLKAEIDFSGDYIPENNVGDPLSVKVKGLGLPVVTDLMATAEGEDLVLDWSQPSLIYDDATLESFENQTALATDTVFGWKMIDGDYQYTGALEGFDYDNAGMPMAYQVWNAVEAGLDIYDVLLPYSDEQCLISWVSAGYSAIDDTPVEQENDDWLISPEIKPGSSLSFWAECPSVSYGNEEFEVWVSTTTDAKEAFTLYKTGELATTNWTKFSYTLPSEARYFAIRHMTSAFALLLDQISYVKADAVQEEYSLMGYNVYKDKVKLNSTLLSEPAYTLTGETTGTFTVSVQYAEGLSGLSNEATLDLLRVQDENPLEGLVYGGRQQITLKDLKGEQIQIFNVAGVQIDAFICQSDRDIYNVTAGVYVIYAGQMQVSTKVIVY